jgi:hypothetical protein
MPFENIEVYVRYADYPYEGESIRFVTIDEVQAATKDIEDASECDCLDVYVNGEIVEAYYWSNGKWLTNKYSKEPSKEFKTETIVINKQIGE